MTDLPEDRLKTIEAGLMHQQQVYHELDNARRKISDMGDQIVHLKMEIEGLNSRINTLLSEHRQYQYERDAAVQHAERYWTSIENMRAIFEQVQHFRDENSVVNEDPVELPSLDLTPIEVKKFAPKAPRGITGGQAQEG